MKVSYTISYKYVEGVFIIAVSECEGCTAA